MEIESVLFCDPQARKALRCPVCGAEVYAPGYFCLRCERREAE